MAAIVKYPGITHVIGGIEYVIPPLSLNAVIQLDERIKNFSGKLDDESINTSIDAVHAALVRNYPDITREQLSDMMDLGNMFDLFECVMDVSGMKRKSLETSGEAGEALPNQK